MTFEERFKQEYMYDFTPPDYGSIISEKIKDSAEAVRRMHDMSMRIQVLEAAVELLLRKSGNNNVTFTEEYLHRRLDGSVNVKQDMPRMSWTVEIPSKYPVDKEASDLMGIIVRTMDDVERILQKLPDYLRSALLKEVKGLPPRDTLKVVQKFIDAFYDHTEVLTPLKIDYVDPVPKPDFKEVMSVSDKLWEEAPAEITHEEVDYSGVEVVLDE